MKNTGIATVLAVAIAVGSAQTAVAQIVPLYTATFNSPTYTDGPLNPALISPPIPPPGQDGWLYSSGTVNTINVSNALSNGFVTLNNTGQDVRRPFDGGATVTAGSAFFGATLIVTAAQGAGDYALHFTDGGTANFYARTYIQPGAAAGFRMALGTSSGTAVTYGADLPFNVPFELLVRYDLISGAGNDTGALFINPTTMDGSGDTPYIAATTIGTDATTIAALALRQGAAGAFPTLTVDNYRAFGVIPEPTSMTFCGVFVAGAVARHWRRKKVQPEA